MDPHAAEKFDADARRTDIGDDTARTALSAAARLLIQAYDDYEDALDRRVPLPELQFFDRQVAVAEQRHAADVAIQEDR